METFVSMNDILLSRQAVKWPALQSSEAEKVLVMADEAGTQRTIYENCIILSIRSVNTIR